MTAQINDTPDVIYLCVGDGLADEGTVGFDELFDVTWCSDQQGPDDIKYVKADRIATLERELAEAKAREERKDQLLQECRGHLKGWKMSMLVSTPERLLAKIEAVLQQKGDINADA